MTSISVELKTTASPSSSSSGKCEVNSNVETPTSGTPGTYRQLQGNIRGDSPSSTSARKPVSDMEVSRGIQLSSGGHAEVKIEDADGGGAGAGAGVEQESNAQKQLKHDQKVSSSEDEELTLEGHVGGKSGKSGEKKKRRLHLSFPRFGGKGKKTSHDAVAATDSTGSDDIPEKKVKVEDKDVERPEEDKIDGMEGEIGMKSDQVSSEQPEWNVNISGCGNIEARANMAATGQGGEFDNGTTTAGAPVSTGFAVSGDTGFNEQEEEADSTRLEESIGEGVDVNVDIGGTSGMNHTAAPPFLDAKDSKEISDSFVTEDQNSNEMNAMDAIEVKLAGMHSNIGFMEADIAEADLRASLILEEPPPDLDLDKTADKEKVVADTNAFLAGDVDVDVAVDVAADDNSTSALLEEIAQTIHAIEEAGGKDSSGGDMNFSLELDDDDEDLYVPKLDLGDMSDDSDTIQEEDEDVDDGDGDLGIKGEIDFSGASTKVLVGNDVEEPNGEAHTDGSLEGGIDLDIGESGERDLSPKGVELSVPHTKRVDGDGGDTNVVPPGGEVKPDNVEVNLDIDQPGTEQIDNKSKVEIPSANVNVKTTGNIDANVGDKKKKNTKGGFHFHFPWFGGKKASTSKNADVSLDTDDLIGGDAQNGDIQNGPQVTMVAGVKDDGNTATLHVVTDANVKREIHVKRSASLDMKAPKKPPRDPSVDSSDISSLELDVNVSLPKPLSEVNGIRLEGDTKMPDVDGQIGDPSIKIEPQLDIDVKMTKPDLEVDIKDPIMDIDLQQDTDITMTTPEVDAGIPDASLKIDLQQDTDIQMTNPEVNVDIQDASLKIELQQDADLNLPHANGGAIVKDTPVIDGNLQLNTDVNISQVNGKVEAQGPSGSIDANGIKVPSVDMDIDAPKSNAKMDDKDLNLGTKDIAIDLDIKTKEEKRKAKLEKRAKAKRKAFTLPSLHFKSARARALQDQNASMAANGRVGAEGHANGEAVGVGAEGQVNGEAGVDVKMDMPDVSANLHVDGGATRSLGDGRSSSDGSIDNSGPAGDVDIGLKGECDCSDFFSVVYLDHNGNKSCQPFN
ncbi:uncharacterized protein [Amphiura filiformis]|uniref:uncharacterized protein n=1 Tax=Amphiura filiformis TaxID=82378 RepID=UPI003B21BF52